LKKGREKKTLFAKSFVTPNLLRLEKALFRTSTIQGFRDKSTLHPEELFVPGNVPPLTKR